MLEAAPQIVVEAAPQIVVEAAPQLVMEAAPQTETILNFSVFATWCNFFYVMHFFHFSQEVLQDDLNGFKKGQNTTFFTPTRWSSPA